MFDWLVDAANEYERAQQRPVIDGEQQQQST
jgi:hypothetical protein